MLCNIKEKTSMNFWIFQHLEFEKKNRAGKISKSNLERTDGKVRGEKKTEN